MSKLRLEIEDARGNILGRVDASSVELAQALDRIGSFSAQIPAGQPDLDMAEVGRYVSVYREDEGYLGTFIIWEKRSPLDEPAAVQLSGPSIEDELRVLNTYTNMEMNNVPLQAALDQLLDGSGWNAIVRDPPERKELIRTLLTDYPESNADSDGVLGNQAANQRLSQGFKVGQDVIAGRVRVYLLLRKQGDPQDGLKLSIETDNAGVPSGTVLATSTRGSSTLTASGYTKLEFTFKVSLTANTQYHLVLTRGGGIDSNNYYLWRMADPGGYGNGSAATYNGNTWTVQPWDFIFEIWLGDTLNVTARFDGESLFQAALLLSNKFNLHVRPNPRNRELEVGSFGQRSGLRVESQAITGSDLNASSLVVASLEKQEDLGSLVNRIIPLGGGSGETQLTLEKSDRTSPYPILTVNKNGRTHWYIEDADSVRRFGPREAVVAFNDIIPITNSEADVQVAANALYDAAVAHLQWFKEPLLSLSLTVGPVRDLQVGDKLDVRGKYVVTQNGQPYAWLDIDDEFFVMSRRRRFEADGRETNQLEVNNIDRQRMTDQDVVASTVRSSQIFQTHPGAYPTAYSYSYERDLDANHPLKMIIPIGTEILKVQHVKLFAWFRPVRSTATGAASGGGTATTSTQTDHQHSVSGQSASSNPGQSSTTEASHTHNVPGHRHFIGNLGTVGGDLGQVNRLLTLRDQFNVDTGVGVRHLGGYDGFMTIHTWEFDGSTTSASGTGHAHNIEHSHSVTTTTATAGGAHSHTVNDPHTHDLAWGIFEGTSPSGVLIFIDGIDRTTELGGPWDTDFEVEISRYLKDPLHGRHEVELRSAQLGAIHVTIRVFAVSQSVAVVA